MRLCFFDNLQRWLLFLQHPVLAGSAYGAAYYVVVNSLALPIYFGDPLPWQLGAATFLPSLFGNMVYGTSIGLTSKRFVSAARAAASLRRA